jgi:signal transduction histidine kinase
MDLARLYAVVWDARSWRLAAWQLVTFPVALVCGVLAWVLYAVGAGLVVVWVGVPILVGAQQLMRTVGRLDAATAQSLAGEPPIPLEPRPAPRKPGWWDAVVRDLTDGRAWRTAAWSGARLVLGPVGFVTALAAVLSPAVAVGGFVMPIVATSLGWYGPGLPWPAWVSLLAGAAALVAGVPAMFWLCRGVAWVQLWLLRWAVSPSAAARIEEQQRRAERAEERVRLDQELHDSIGHMITMNTVQAGAGAHVFDTDPEFARQALRTIEERGRAAMGELDRIIATVQAEQGGGEPGPQDRAPLPGLADLPGLIERSAAAGVPVSAVLEPPPGLSPAVGRAVFGIVREALTNAARYAPGAPVAVTVVGDGDAVGVEVRNAAPVAPVASDAVPRDGRTGQGRGLAGIRDRAILLGGRAWTGPADGGFRVRALLPVGAALGPAAPDRPSSFDDLRGTVTG